MRFKVTVKRGKRVLWVVEARSFDDAVMIASQMRAANLNCRVYVSDEKTHAYLEFKGLDIEAEM